jgi:hypothetical protein
VKGILGYSEFGERRNASHCGSPLSDGSGDCFFSGWMMWIWSSPLKAPSGSCAQSMIQRTTLRNSSVGNGSAIAPPAQDIQFSEYRRHGWRELMLSRLDEVIGVAHERGLETPSSSRHRLPAVLGLACLPVISEQAFELGEVDCGHFGLAP